MTPDWIAPSRTALLLIDMQVDFGSPDGVMAGQGFDTDPAQEAAGEARTLADAARAAGVAVVFVRLVTVPGRESPLAQEARRRRGDDAPDLCVDGTPGAAFIGPQPRPGEAVVSKSRYSAFAGTGLAERLHAKGIDTLVLAGLTTECCVASTAWHAFEQDFHVFIAADACAAYEDDLHHGALEALQASGAMIGEVADFARAWKKV